jgi:hypothetical protein
VHEAVISAYYEYEIAGVDRARSRAESAYAVTGALATGLLGIGLLTTLESASAWVRLVGTAAFLVATFAALLYARAIGDRRRHMTSPQDPPNADTFVDHVIESIDHEAADVEHGRRVASRVSLVAVGLAVATLITALVLPPASARSRITLTSEAAAAVTALCGGNATTLTGFLELASVDRPFLVLTVTDGACRSRKLYLPRTGVLIVGTDP